MCGNPGGKPVVVLHGGPGSGCTPGWRRYLNPDAYRFVLFDQRGCGRSTPHASAPTTDLATNTTQHLVADIESLRRHLGIERWLLYGGSWGSTLAYAQRHPERVTEIVLFGIATTRREVEWVTRHVGRLFRRTGPASATAYRRTSATATSPQRTHACSTMPTPRSGSRRPSTGVPGRTRTCGCGADHGHDERYDDPVFRMAFARLVTHYWSHAAFLEDGILLREAGRLAGIPGVLVRAGSGLLHAGEQWAPARFLISRHVHPVWELYLQVHGRNRWSADGRVWTVQPGHLLAVGPGVGHQMVEEPGANTHFYFAAVDLATVLARHPAVARARELLDREYPDPWSLAALADRVGLAPTYLAALFAAHVGTPPHRYLIERRLDRARQLLSTSDLPITAIALEVGFGSGQHLARAFRRSVGATPREYRAGRHAR